MVKAKDTASLLALCDLHSSKSSNYLSTFIKRYLKATDTKEKKLMLKEIKNFLRMTSNDKNLKYT